MSSNLNIDFKPRPSQPSALPAGKRGALMREAAHASDSPDGGGRTLVCASLDGWDTQHAFPSAKVNRVHPD